MVREFTEEDRLREQNRLHEAWLRDRQYEKYAKKKLEEELAYERKMRKQEAQEREEIEEIERETEEIKREIEEIKRKAKEFQRKAIPALRKVGCPDTEIAEMLDMTEDAVKQIV